MRSFAGFVLVLSACHHASAPKLRTGVAPVSTSPGSGPAQYVNPFVGSGNATVTDPVDNGGSGATFPGVSMPFGMVQWSPDTPTAAPPGYNYADNQIIGFSMTHLNGAGCPAQRDFPVMPLLQEYDVTANPSASFKHESEIASPGFYEVTLDTGIKVDLTATVRTGLARFTFPPVPAARLVITGGMSWDFVNLKGFSLKIAGPDLITGTRSSDFCGSFAPTQVYYAARFDRPFSGSEAWGPETGGGLDSATTAIARYPGGAVLTFDTRTNAIVHMKVGLSYVSLDNALANLDAESAGWDFDAVHQKATDQWNNYLGRVQVSGGTDDARRTFYSALYHVFLQPNTFSDVNGDFTGFDGAIHHGDGHVRYANFSGWDIYRSWIQLVALLAPDETSDLMHSLIESGAECGALPKWAYGHDESGVMVGDPSDVIIANAWAFGARKFETDTALALMLKGATDPTARCHRWEARTDLVDYLNVHYCSVDGSDASSGSPSTTLEYALADFALAQFAQALGKPDVATTFMDRGLYWRNVFDPALKANGFTGFMQPRFTKDMSGAPDFQVVDVTKRAGFVEGNATQYTFMVPHDVAGLIQALGGDATTIQRLDAFFTQLNAGMNQPYAYLGNEPSFDAPWLYPFAGAPWRTQDVIRRALTQLFTPTPSGLPGNDDLGTMSSWAVWSMLGMYPAIPGVGGVVLGSPTFDRAELTLAGGKKLVILGDNAAPGNPYVQSLTVNGQPSTRTWVPVETLLGGATLEFKLGSQPNTAWGAGPQDRPPSFYSAPASP
jgi:predicted alpha-1,2-mannosidase